MPLKQVTRRIKICDLDHQPLDILTFDVWADNFGFLESTTTKGAEQVIHWCIERDIPFENVAWRYLEDTPDLIEIRIRSKNNDKPWEEARIYDVLRPDSYWYHHLDDYARALSLHLQKGHLDTLLEIRWNFEGNPQGHYIKPDGDLPHGTIKALLTLSFTPEECEELKQRAREEGFDSLQKFVDRAVSIKQQDILEYLWGY